jgi:hypothetical protein
VTKQFLDRLKQYSNPESPKNWHGCSREQGYLDRWSERATANSDGNKHRASGDVHISLEKDQDLPQLPPDKAVRDRDSEMRPYRSRKADAAMVDAKEDPNHVGSNYMKSVRRTH